MVSTHQVRRGVGINAPDNAGWTRGGVHGSPGCGRVFVTTRSQARRRGDWSKNVSEQNMCASSVSSELTMEMVQSLSSVFVVSAISLCPQCSLL